MATLPKIVKVDAQEQLDGDLLHPSVMSRLATCKCSTCHSLAELLRRASNLVNELQELVEIARLSSVSQQHYLQEALADYGHILANFVEHTATCGGCIRQRRDERAGEGSCETMKPRRRTRSALQDPDEFRPTG